MDILPAELERKFKNDGYHVELKAWRKSNNLCFFVFSVEVNEQQDNLNAALIIWKSPLFGNHFYYFLSSGNEINNTDVVLKSIESFIKKNDLIKINHDFNLLNQNNIFERGFNNIFKYFLLSKEKELLNAGHNVNINEKSFYALRFDFDISNKEELKCNNLIYQVYNIGSDTYILFNDFDSVFNTKLFLQEIANVLDGEVMLTSDVINISTNYYLEYV